MTPARTIGLGIAFATGATLLILVTAARLVDFDIVGPTVPFAYPWRLSEPTAAARVSAWAGYALHNLGVWLVILLARRSQPRYRTGFHWFNWALLAVNGAGIAAHHVQTDLWYDGLARDVPEVTALGSVALMLIVVLILDSPRRGLFFGKPLPFARRFLWVVREYHGYVFSWAIIYTFWYHPLVDSPAHLAGFFYMYLLLWQSALLFTRAHVDRRWTLFLELLVIPHGAIVAYFQGNGLWPMFAFGFGAIFILTQMHGLGWSRAVRSAIGVGFVISAVGIYTWVGRLALIHEIIRIPVIDYGVVLLLYALFWLGNTLATRLWGATGVN